MPFLLLFFYSEDLFFKLSFLQFETPLSGVPVKGGEVKLGGRVGLGANIFLMNLAQHLFSFSF